MVVTAVLGARGYLGRELVRLLVGHPEVDTVVPASTAAAGQPLGDHVPAFRRSGLVLAADDADAVLGADVVFLATPQGAARDWVAAHGREPSLVIDLSRDHRADAFGGDWHYGLADLRPAPRGTTRIANPGCYPTATLLAAAPALQGGLCDAGVLIADGKSGVSGAGATPRADLHFPEANEAIRAYKVLGHDHTAEIRSAAAVLEGNGAAGGDGARPVRFTPHLVPQNRGLLSTVYLPIKDGLTSAQAHAAYAETYADAPFVTVVGEPDTSAVRHSNRADVAVDVDPDTGLLIARCAIDNLQKGGSGTAVQNMNDALGFAPTTGLAAIGGGP